MPLSRLQCRYVEVVVGGAVVKVKHPGSYFGDDTALCGIPLRESYRAATDAELLVLPADQLLAMLPLFPDIEKRISAVIGHMKKR